MDRSNEEDDTKKYECQFCSRRFSSAKALGSHTRIHYRDIDNLAESSSSSSEEEEETERASRVESGYNLRKNPSKTKRLVDEIENAFKKWFRCKECGEDFDSRKALNGHMASHSETEKLAMDDQSDIQETSASGRRKRSEKAVIDEGFGNSASSLSDTEQEINQEQAVDQEVITAAKTFMMLSRDSGFTELGDSASSVNKSVVMEAKPCSCDPRITSNNNSMDFKHTPDADEILEIKEQGTDVIVHSSYDSDSEYFLFGPKIAESEGIVHRFHENLQLGKSEAEFKTTHHNESVKSKSSSSEKQEKWICLTCFKKLRSAQVMESDKRSDFFETQKNTGVVIREGEPSQRREAESLELDKSDAEFKAMDYTESVKSKSSGSKKQKEHGCPIYGKKFKSAQALACHRRSHSLKTQKNTGAVIREEEPTQKPSLVDLNLPAPEGVVIREEEPTQEPSLVDLNLPAPESEFDSDSE